MKLKYREEAEARHFGSVCAASAARVVGAKARRAMLRSELRRYNEQRICIEKHEELSIRQDEAVGLVQCLLRQRQSQLLCRDLLRRSVVDALRLRQEQLNVASQCVLAVFAQVVDIRAREIVAKFFERVPAMFKRKLLRGAVMRRQKAEQMEARLNAPVLRSDAKEAKSCRRLRKGR
jgi:hypothetical protein